MKFASRVFLIAGIWGLAIVTPLYFMFDRIGRDYPPPVTHPDFYYGFLTVTMAWQVAFLVISTDPVRFRPAMIAAIVEKFGYVATMVVLYGQGRVSTGQFAVCGPDFLLGLLFVAAFVTSNPRRSAHATA